MQIIIEGDPIAKKRHRSARRGAHIIQYDEQEREKREFRYKILQALPDDFESKKVLEYPFYEVRLCFYMPIPKSRKKRHHLEIYHGCKPDLDNLIKFVLDCGNEILWSDDRKIAGIHARKMYAPITRTEIFILPLG